MESGHAEAASTTATAASSGDRRDRFSLNNGLSLEEHNELVKSVESYRGSVGRIILANKETKEVIQTGTAFLVYKGDERSLFLTCSHNFWEELRGEVIRLLDTATGDYKVEDYPIENIVYRHKKRDLLLFSVKNLLPERQCLEFSTDEIKRKDKVVVLGFSGGPLPINNKQFVPNNKQFVPAPVVAHSILTGVVCTDPYKIKADQQYEKVYYGCQAIQGHSGSPLFKNGKVVAVHIAADKDFRDGVSTNTVMLSLREHLKLGPDKEATIDKLLEGLYKKSGHVPPDAELQPVKKKSKGKARS